MPERAGPPALRSLLGAMIATKAAARPSLAQAKAQLLEIHAELLAAGATPYFIAPLYARSEAGRGGRHSHLRVNPAPEGVCAQEIAAQPAAATLAAGGPWPHAGRGQVTYQPGGSCRLLPSSANAYDMRCLPMNLEAQCLATTPATYQSNVMCLRALVSCGTFRCHAPHSECRGLRCVRVLPLTMAELCSSDRGLQWMDGSEHRVDILMGSLVAAVGQ